MRLFQDLWQRIRDILAGGRMLCDSCKYDYPGACRNRERPNARRCPDYRRR